MLPNKFSLTKTVEEPLRKDYIAMCYPIKYKDKYERENEVMLDSSKPAFFVRLAFKFDDPEKTFSNYLLPKNYRFVPLPYLPLDSEQERSVIYISGAAGKGKSYLANQLAELYHKFFPNNKIYFITTNDWKNDRSLDKDLYQFINTNEFIELFKDPEVVKDFTKTSKYNNSMFIFDDIGMVEKSGKEADKAIWTVIDTIIENKRKNEISIIVISHLPTNFVKTRLLVRECKEYICFPKNQQILSDRFLKSYLALSTKQIDQIASTDSLTSSWVLIDNERKLILTQRAIYFTNKEIPRDKMVLK